jgi:CubicO group peptidase (beta-lactamase class C family)
MRLGLCALNEIHQGFRKNSPRWSILAVIFVSILAYPSSRMPAYSSGQGVAGELPAAEPEQVGVSTAGLRRLVDVLRGDVETGYIPGAVVFVARRGKTVLNEAFGWRDADKRIAMTTDSIFRLYSMTKPITTVAAMTLVEEGRLSLDDPVGKYIPELADLSVGVEEGGRLRLVPAARPILVHHLLTHTSGFAFEYLGDSLVKQRLRDAGVRNGKFDNAELMKRLASLPLAHQPGTMWEYGYSLDVVGRIIEVISGKSLYEFEKERVLDPLDMRDTSFSLADENHRERLAEPFADDRDPPQGFSDPRQPTKWESGGNGMTSTVRDYARFLTMLQNGGSLGDRKILTRKTVELMTSDHLGTAVRPGPIYLPGPGYGFGLGFAVRLAPGLAAYPGSVGDYDWGGVLGTEFWVDPAEQLLVVFMTQTAKHSARYENLLRYLIYAALTN